MKIELKPTDGTSSNKPVATVNLNEVIALLEILTGRKFSDTEKTIALPIIENLKAGAAEITLHDVIDKFKKVDELASFAEQFESILGGGDYAKFFNKNQVVDVDMSDLKGLSEQDANAISGNISINVQITNVKG